MISEQINAIQFYSNSGNYEKLKDACLALLASDPHNPYALDGLMTAYYYNLDHHEKDFLETSKKCLLHVSEPNAKARIFDILTSYYIIKHNFGQAKKHISEALLLCPNNALYIARNAKVSAFSGNKVEFEVLIKTAFSIEPNNYYVLYEKFDAYYSLYNDKDMEKALIEKMLPLSPDPFAMNMTIANHHYKFREFEEAYDFFVKAVLINPNMESLNSILQDLEHRIEEEFLIKEFEKGLNQDNALELTNLWRNASETQNFHALLYFCQKLDGLGISNPGFLYAYAKSAWACKQLHLCESICKRAALHPTTKGHVQYIWGCCYYSMKNYEKAYPHLKNALDINPRQLLNFIYLVRCLAEMGKLEEALTCVEYGNFFHKESLEVLHSLYIILYKFSDDFNREIESLEKLEKRMIAANNENFCQIQLYNAMTCEKYEKFDLAHIFLKDLKCVESIKLKHRIESRRKKSNGRTSIFSIFKRKKSGRQTYPLSSWENL